MNRKLVTLRKINEIKSIPDADAIELAIIDGWQCVVKKNEFKVNDNVFYFEIDSFLPTDRTEFAFLASKDGRQTVYNGVVGHRLRTIKLRKQLSQGLVIAATHDYTPDEHGDYSQCFGVQKWESPVPAQLAGTVRSTFPSFIQKTDQERVQNFSSILKVRKNQIPHETFEVTQKLDGSSMTVYKFNNDYGVCSRNLSLKETENNTFWKIARQFGLIDILLCSGRNFALQGELIGEGIQKNPEEIKGHKFYLFDIFDIDDGRYLLPVERHSYCTMNDIIHVPIIESAYSLSEDFSIEKILSFADGKSIINNKTDREGLVFKSNIDTSFSFKAISNNYLLKEK